MKILNSIQKVKEISIKYIDNPLRTKAAQGLEQDTVELSTKKAKESKLSKIKALIKNNATGLDKATIKHLERLPVEEFLAESQKLIAKSMNLEKDFSPPVIISSFENNKFFMLFDFSSNRILINNKYLGKSRVSLFSCLKHEMKHFMQNMQIVRTEGLGEQAIETYSKLGTKAGIDNFVSIFKNMPQGEINNLKESGALNEAALQAISKLQKASVQGNKAVDKITEELFKQDFLVHLESWKKVRNKAIELYGPIKAGTKEASDSKEYFEDLLKTNGMSNGKEYYDSKHEVEAYSAQIVAMGEYMFKKFFG